MMLCLRKKGSQIRMGSRFLGIIGQIKKVLEHKLKELKGNEDDYPPDIETSLGTFDFIMDALKSLSEEYTEAVIDNLCDYQREIDSNVVITHESVCSSAGSSRCY